MTQAPRLSIDLGAASNKSDWVFGDESAGGGIVVSGAVLNSAVVVVSDPRKEL